jgi:hypothetical protein
LLIAHYRDAAAIHFASDASLLEGTVDYIMCKFTRTAAALRCYTDQQR